MQQLYLTMAISALTVVLLGLTSGPLQKLPVSRPLLALCVGIAAGPTGAGLLRPDEWGAPHAILKEAARLTLAISVMGVALRVPIRDLLELRRPLLILLGPGLLLMWAVSSGLAWLAFGLAPLLAMSLGAALTPTDPVVAASIVTGHVAEAELPQKSRSILSAESGANDGLAYLLVLLPLLMMTEGSEAGLTQVITHVIPVDLLLAVGIGATLGGLTGVALRVGDRRGWVEHSSLLGLSVALALLAVAGAHAVGSDGILASFAAGVAFNTLVDREAELEDENVQEAVTKLFTLPVFVLTGALLPWNAWLDRGWTLLIFALAVLVLRRPLAILLLVPFLKITRRDAVFFGWFGPVGVAAIYYALHAEETLHDPRIWAMASAVVAVSVLLHGVTASPGVMLYGRRAKGTRPE
ncbi:MULTISPECIES: cation:proton antiporter domain-containing protein [unclassified Roseovarius]|uniref:cation:proton antiporter domain-containing protein n=1 Tax=unclassified Roseovarius TaxID=2614913 RepID=UPI00273FA602|nr:cation:proton antiporter [Roseovarius sp. MMSF_3350]